MLRFGKLLIRKVPRERGVLTRDRGLPSKGRINSFVGSWRSVRMADDFFVGDLFDCWLQSRKKRARSPNTGARAEDQLFCALRPNVLTLIG